MARIINSPGVQLTEKDLSLRSTLPAGTQVFVPGFAPQGPTIEPLMITTVSELEQVYGVPGTAAERYFYYSCREILNSPAVLNTIRLPYGPGSGADFSTAYAGLFYPMVNIWETWYIGAPISKTLTLDEYNSIESGNFTWDGTATSALTSALANVDLTPGALAVQAGFFILNDLQTVINETGEGYYVAFADNSGVQSDPVAPDYSSILKFTTLSGPETFSTLADASVKARLDFTLSASRLDADRGLASISEELEQVGFTAFASEEYQDHLSVGVFKIRRGVNDPTKLSIAKAEKYLGSMNANRKTLNPTGGSLVNAFLGEVINNNSPSIKVFVNPAISNQYTWTENSALPTSRVTVLPAAKHIYPLGVYTSDTAGIDASKQIGEVPLKLDRALRNLDNVENTIIDVIIDAGLSTIYSVAKQQEADAEVSFDDTYYVTTSAQQDDWQTVANTLINFSQNARKDCFSIIDPPRSCFISGRDSKIVDDISKSFTADIYAPLKACVDELETNYAAVYANWVKVPDLFTGKRFWLPVSGHVAAVFGRNDAAAQTWTAPAGLNRGLLGNVLDIGFNPNQKQRDRLYEIATNPIVYFSGDGYAVYGQKTLQNKPTAFDRINVRRLFLTLERAVLRTIKYFVFEPNTSFTRKRVVDTIKPIFELCKQTQGIYDYLIVSDNRNNPPDTIDNNELVVDIYLKPVRSAEFILVNFIATRTSQNFQELL